MSYDEIETKFKEALILDWKTSGKTQALYASSIGMSRQYFSQLINNRRTGKRVMVEIAKKIGFNMDTLEYEPKHPNLAKENKFNVNKEVFELIPRLRAYFNYINAAAKLGKKNDIIRCIQEMANDKNIGDEGEKTNDNNFDKPRERVG